MKKVSISTPGVTIVKLVTMTMGMRWMMVRDFDCSGSANGYLGYEPQDALQRSVDEHILFDDELFQAKEMKKELTLLKKVALAIDAVDDHINEGEILSKKVLNLL